ncbi:hypothetical protein Leryth_017941 [Lithospermum erythrorhizon]|nr:hypothetical protein Leryth_017941 [Lithospermum erythrorhizon]
MKRDMFSCSLLVTLLLLLLIVNFSVSACPEADRSALLDFEASLNEPYLGIFKTWSGTNCCNWYGVGCDPTTQRVSDIVLRGESTDPMFEKAGRSGYMTGSLSKSLCKLDKLTTLIVADWKDITGEIPACIPGSLSSLHILDLVGNRISGRIPVDIGSMSKLKVLNLADNQITGSVPGSLVKLGDLKHLDLSNNKLTGSIPSDIGKLTMMSRALLNGNQLTGSIPVSFSKIYRLADLDLSMNKLTGPIPSQLGSMHVLSTLNLDSNQLSGQWQTRSWLVLNFFKCYDMFMSYDF